MKQVCVVFLASLLFLSPIYGFEREQEIPRMINKEQQLLMHFMQGKNFFKESDYEKAKQEFLRVVDINAEYSPAYQFLERIQDIEIKRLQAEELKQKRLNNVMDRVADGQMERRPTDDDLFYQLTNKEQRKLDGYVGDNEFTNMLEEQRIEVFNKVKDVKSDIDEVLSEGRKRDVMRNVAERSKPFVVRGYEPRTEGPEARDDRVLQVNATQDEVDQQFYHNRRNKIKDFYDKGVVAYKQHDYYVAKQYFEQVINLEPSYRYAQDYFESSKSQMVLEEIQKRRQEVKRRSHRSHRKVEIQEPIDQLSDTRMVQESQIIAEDMSREFQRREAALKTGHKKELFYEGIKAYKEKDYSKALNIFEHILRYDPKYKKAKKYRQKSLEMISAREDIVLQTMSQVQTEADHAYLATNTSKSELQRRAGETVATPSADLALQGRGMKVDDLYEKGKRLYRQKEYLQALNYFKELELIDPAHHYVAKYIRRCEDLLAKTTGYQKEQGMDFDVAYKDGLDLYKRKKYKAAAHIFWDILKLDPTHRKSQKLLKRCLAYLKTDVKTLFLNQGDADSSEKPAELVITQAMNEEQKNVQDPQALYVRAKQLYREHYFKEAIPLFEHVVKMIPGDAQALRYLERSRERVGEQLETEKENQVISKVAKTEVEQQVNEIDQAKNAYETAKNLYREGRYEEAIPHFETVVRLQPNHRYAPRYIKRSREKMAEDQVVPVQPKPVTPVSTPATTEDSFEVLYEQGKTLYRKGDYKGAIPVFEKAMAMQPDHRYVPRYLKRSKEKLAQEDQGEETFEQLYEKGKTLYRKADYAAAIPVFEKAMAMQPDHRYVPRYLKRSQEKLADRQAAEVKSVPPVVTGGESAKVAKEEAKTLTSESYAQADAPTTLSASVEKLDSSRIYEQAKILFRQRNYEEAIKKFQKVIDLDPQHRYATRYLKKSQEKLGTSVVEKPAPVKHVPKVIEVDVSMPPKKVAPMPESKEHVDDGSAYNDEDEALLAFDRKTPMPYPAVDQDDKKKRMVERKEKARKKYKARKERQKKREKKTRVKNKVKNVVKTLPVVSRVLQSQSELLYNQGLASYKGKQFLRAAERFERSSLLDPANVYSKRFLKTCIESIERRGLVYLPVEMIEKGPFYKAQNAYAKGRRYFYHKRMDKAQKMFEKALQLNPQNDLYRRARVHVDEFRQKLMIQDAESKLSAADKQALKESYETGLGFYQKKMYSEALTHFQKASDIFSDNVQVKKALEACQIQLALKTSTSAPISSKKPEVDVEALYKQGKERFRNKKYQEALTLFEEVLRLNPNNKYAKGYVRNIKRKMAELGTASDENSVPSLLEFFSSTPSVDVSESLFVEGKRQYELKEYQEALRLFYAVSLSDPLHRYAPKYVKRCEKFVNAQWWSAEKLSIYKSFRGTPSYEYAVKRFVISKRALKKSQKLFKQAKTLLRKKKYEQASNLIDRIFKINPYLEGLYELHEELRKNMASPQKTRKKAVPPVVKTTISEQTQAKERQALEQLQKEVIQQSKIADNDFAKELQLLEEQQKQYELLMSEFNRARKLYDDGHYMQSLKAFQRVLVADPENSYAKMFAQYAQERIKEQQKLDFELKKVESLQKGMHLNMQTSSPQVRTQSTESKKNMIKKEEIKKEVVQDKVLLNIESAQGLMKQNRYSEAIDLLKKTWSMPAAKQRIDQIQALLEESYASMGEIVEPVVDEKEKKIRLKHQLFNQGKAAFKREEWELAALQFEKALKIDPEWPLAKQYRGLSQKKLDVIQNMEISKLEQMKLADELKLVAQQNQMIQGLLNSGKDLYQKGQYDLSLEIFEKIVSMDAEHKIAHDYIQLSKDSLLKQQYNEEKVMSDLQLRQIRKEREMALKQKKIREEEEMIQKIKARSEDVQSFLKEGKRLYELGDFVAAGGVFEQLLQRDPKHKLAFEYLSLCRQQQQLIDTDELNQVVLKQKAVLAQEIDLANTAADAFAKGEQSFQMGDMQRAMGYFKRAWALDQSYQSDTIQAYLEKISERMKVVQNENVNYLSVLYEQGKSYFIAEEWANALSVFQQVIKIDKNYKSVQMYVQVAQDEVEALKHVA